VRLYLKINLKQKGLEVWRLEVQTQYHPKKEKNSPAECRAAAPTFLGSEDSTHALLTLGCQGHMFIQLTREQLKQLWLSTVTLPPYLKVPWLFQYLRE
jgi:hypothetical protein